MNHLHQTCITCINPASPTSTLHHLHHAQKAASTLHQPRTGCITRTRGLGKPKHQAPSTQVTRNRPYARCPLPHRNGRRGCPASQQRARPQRARARARPDADDPQRARARADSPRAAWTEPLRHRTARDVRRAPARGRAPPPVRGGERMERGLELPAECGVRRENDSTRKGGINTCSTAAARTTRDPRAHHAHLRCADVTVAAIRAGESRTARSGFKEKTRHETRGR